MIIGTRKGDYSRPESEIPCLFASQFENHRSPPVSILGRRIRVSGMRDICARISNDGRNINVAEVASTLGNSPRMALIPAHY